MKPGSIHHLRQTINNDIEKAANQKSKNQIDYCIYSIFVHISDNRTQLEDRQIHGDNNAANNGSKENNNDRLHQA